MTSKPNILITSGSYIGEEMQAEFGRIPPAFLPVGPTHLAQHQLRRLGNHGQVWLSVPNDYTMDKAQLHSLEEHDVNIIRIDPAKSLGMSVFQSIVEMGIDTPLEIIHGDTLVDRSGNTALDRFSVEAVIEQYSWGLVEVDGMRVRSVSSESRSDRLTEDSLILSGYFSFSATPELLRCLSRTDFDFVAAIDRYCQRHEVTAVQDLAALDFGHLKTYYSSRYKLAAARHFNTLSIDGYTVLKKSRDTAKIDAEANWLRSVPAELQPFTARLVEDSARRTVGEYQTVYANFPTVSELYLAQPSRFVWRKILDSCEEYLALAAQSHGPEDVSPLQWLAVGKLHQRLADYPDFLPARDTALSINGLAVGSLDTIVQRIETVIAGADLQQPCIMHGDFCFSNMLFDVRSDRIVLIDPRGVVQGAETIYGDIRYDIAKLGHSIVGRYDQIIAAQLTAESGGNGDYLLDIPTDPLRNWLEEQFREMEVAGIDFSNEAVNATMVSLFLSMIPLHADDPQRQVTLFANALRLFATYFPDNRTS